MESLNNDFRAPMKTTLHLTILFIIFFINSTNGQVFYENAFPNLNFNFPVEIQSSVDGSNRLYVIEQPGIIKVFQNNPTVASAAVSTFLDVSNKVSYSAGQEIGLLGMAFHPNFLSNGFVYVYYIDQPSTYRINIVRYKVSATDPNTIDTSTETIIGQFTKNQGDSNHNGGKIAFGPDGYLYVSIGDGGGGGDPQGNGQNLNTVFGSLLRIDVDVDGNNPVENNPEQPNGNYEIPADNPRVGQSGLDEIYAWGIRNTWKFSFDSNGTLWGADVGQNNFEEINLITKGGNYGWNKFEASTQPSYGSNTTLATTPDVKPIYSYDHNNGDVSITGGYVYRGSLNSSAVKNKYIYADYVSGRVWALEYNQTTGSTTNQLLFRTNGELVSSFGEDELGELYFSGYGSSVKIFKFTEEDTEPVTTPVNGVGEWKPIKSGVNGAVETLVEATNGTIYVGGNFSSAGGITVSNLALINSNGEWESFGAGSNGTIFSMAIAPNGNLYAAGDFTQIGTITANNIGFWNGSTWSSLGDGTNGPISTIAFDETGAVFAGGFFSEAGGIPVNNIAKWNATTWSPLMDATTGSIGTNNEIRSMAFDENNVLYVGGNFDTAGGNSAARIAQWNGTNWSALGPGTSGFVQAIAIKGNYIYAGGNFTISGSQTVNRITRFNKTSGIWEKLGSGLSGNVNSMVANDTYIYVGGTFETASNQGTLNLTMNNIARWSPLRGWEALGTNSDVGVDNRINSLLLTRDTSELLVGGNFSMAGLTSSNNVTLWSEPLCTNTTLVPEYQLNGEWESGSESITVDEGDRLILSLLPDTASFTLKSPNGTVVNGDYNLGTVTPEQTGDYIYTTNDGCTRNLEIIVRPTINGNVDSPPFSADQFNITSTGTSCIGTNNGIIRVESKTTDSFTANLSGPVKNELLVFSGLLTIDNLQTGTYTLCINSADYPNYENCSKIIITEPDPLAVQLQLNPATNRITLKMNTNGHTVTINGKSKYIMGSELELPLNDAVNAITVIPDQKCLGTFEKTVMIEDAVLLFPNPVGNTLSIALNSLTSTTLEITIFTEAGVLITSENRHVSHSVITLDTSALSSGIYFLRLKNENMDKSFKLIKS